MEGAILLSGLGKESSAITASVANPKACTATPAVFPTLGNETRMVCLEDSKPALNQPAVRIVRKGRGRPKGTTVKHGAKSPKVTSACSTTRIVAGPGGKPRCMCGDTGKGANTRLLPMSACKNR